ncbi:MAG TPA: N-acetylmuramoyl-L-alanine amidase [Blastocatellia bacterium]|nr:N-acetylmuramoyl-L-alanine amidase [Blastocatellia bacterium]
MIADAVICAVVCCLTARPILNAANSERHAHKTGALAESLFDYAEQLSHDLHERSLEARSLGDYRRALDAYAQVVRLNADNFYSAESLSARAELQREMADVSGDAALYQQAIESYGRLVSEHPHSAFVGQALVNIAQIYEENLQDLDGAANAYRELIRYFPDSIMAREARAVLARFDAQLARRPIDVTVAAERHRDGVDEMTGPRLMNVRNFAGPDYARIVIDLSDEVGFAQQRAGNHLTVRLANALVASSLFGRRFIVGDSSLLKRITVAESDAATVQVDIEVGSPADYSAFRLAQPDRIVIDLHATGTVARAEGNAARDVDVARHPEATKARTVAETTTAKAGADIARPRTNMADRSAIFNLPEINEPILPMSSVAATKPADAPPATAQELGAKVDAKAAEAPIKRIVIDPGHGGHDTGTISPSGMREKDLVLDVALKLRAYIKHKYPDVEVILTRDSDRFIALEERTAIANSRRADLFISIHANASPARAASGVETYFLSPDRAPQEDADTAARENARVAAETPADKAKPVIASVTVGNRVAESRELARYIQSGLVRGIGAASPRTAMNRGVKHAAFVVLLGAAMPSVLAEVSFLSNPQDDALLQTSPFRDRVAASLFAGLNAYLKRNRPAATGASH